jgi:peptide/nickel transport system substrate-binding protein
MNGSNPFFTDRRVRYAMTHALNVPLINEKVYYNIATPCRGMYHPDAPFYNPEIKPLKYDPAKAAALLDEAGWKVDPNDGWRYKDIDGQRTLFRFELTYPQASPVAPQICAIFQQDLQRIGVQMTTRSIEWATFLVRTRDHDFQAETAAWGTGTDPDDDWNLWRTDQYKTGRNYGGYSNPRVDKLFEQGRREFDQAKRWKIYAEIDKLIYEDQPYSWLMFRPTTAAIQKRIRGIVFCPRGLDGFTPGALGWWVPRSTTAAAAMP